MSISLLALVTDVQAPRTPSDVLWLDPDSSVTMWLAVLKSSWSSPHNLVTQQPDLQRHILVNKITLETWQRRFLKVTSGSRSCLFLNGLKIDCSVAVSSLDVVLRWPHPMSSCQTRSWQVFSFLDVSAVSEMTQQCVTFQKFPLNDRIPTDESLINLWSGASSLVCKLVLKYGVVKVALLVID